MGNITTIHHLNENCNNTLQTTLQSYTIRTVSDGSISSMVLYCKHDNSVMKQQMTSEFKCGVVESTSDTAKVRTGEKGDRRGRSELEKKVTGEEGNW